MKTKLTEGEVTKLLQTCPEWKLQGGRLVRQWTFPDFRKAMAFVNRVAEFAESANHHPDIEVHYTKVMLSLTSHDANGLTSRDAAMAKRIDEEFRVREK